MDWCSIVIETKRLEFYRSVNQFQLKHNVVRLPIFNFRTTIRSFTAIVNVHHSRTHNHKPKINLFPNGNFLHNRIFPAGDP